jgi:calcineurin-like phosphoesterase family protein
MGEHSTSWWGVGGRGFAVAALAASALLVTAAAVARGGTAASPDAASGGAPVIAAAGDIACDPSNGDFAGGNGVAGACKQRSTADLLGSRPLAAVLALGDSQYENATASGYARSFDPSWGRFKSLIRPAVGNHEYLSGGAGPYFDYFGAAAGPRSAGYYSYDIGDWHLVSLNSNCSKAGGCGAGSPQELWLRADLAAHPARCTLAYWHHPRFSSGPHGSTSEMAPIWAVLVEGGADVVLSGHDHDYERFAPLDAGGKPDAKGVREFVVGTGGRSHYGIRKPITGSEVHNDQTFGVLNLTLRPTGYDWRFVPIAGSSFGDAGSADCP